MRTAWLILMIAVLAFGGGVVAGVAGLSYLQDAFSSKGVARGTVLLEQQPDPTASLLPPQGYYVESTGIERVYIEADAINTYLGQSVQAIGRLDTVCGPDGFPCYPVVQRATITTQP